MDTMRTFTEILIVAAGLFLPSVGIEPGLLLPAFPGAEGEGMFAAGGRGGDVCHVLNTSDSGPGSLRECTSTQNGPRTIVFDTGGTITLESPLRFRDDNLTLAGETAPGDGIQIRGYQVDVSADDVIIRHLRFRAGDVRKKQCPNERAGFTEDSLSLSGSRIIVDHVSASWGVDECLSAAGEFHDVTIQHSIIAEGLHQTGLFHGECNSDYEPGGDDGHSMGSLLKPGDGDMNISVHHNLYAHNDNRNPCVGTYETSQEFEADIRNNVIYNCPHMGYSSGASERGRINYIGNIGIWGPSTSDNTLFDPSESNNVDLYQSGNLIDRDRNLRFDGFDRDWLMFGGDYNQAGSPFSMSPVTTDAAVTAYHKVLADAGAAPWNRDPIDRRIVQDVVDETGEIINSQDEVGGYPDLVPGIAPIDTDRDGMPDWWEVDDPDLDPQVQDNNGDIDGNGYTNLEDYLHYMASAACIDHDGDGYGLPANDECAHPEEDCDDLHPLANPELEEGESSGNCSDGLDNDCDGMTDASDPDCPGGCFIKVIRLNFQ